MLDARRAGVSTPVVELVCCCPHVLRRRGSPFASPRSEHDMAPGITLTDHLFYPAFHEWLHDGPPFEYVLSFDAFARETPASRLPFVVRGAAGLRPAKPDLRAGLRVGPGRRLSLDVGAEMDLQLGAEGTVGVGTATHDVPLLKYEVKTMLTALVEAEADVRLATGKEPRLSSSWRLDVGGSLSATYGPALLPVPVGLVRGRLRATVWDGKHWAFSNVKLDVLNVGVSAFPWEDSWKLGAGVSAVAGRPLGRGSYELKASAFFPANDMGMFRAGEIPFAIYMGVQVRY